MAKKMKRIGPFGWFARAFAAGFGTVSGGVSAAVLGTIVLGSVVSTDFEFPAFAYPHVAPTATYSAPCDVYPGERTASAESYGYPQASYPVVTPPSINAPADAMWQLIDDFGAAGRYLAGVVTCTVAGEGVGARRTLPEQLQRATHH